MNTITKYFNSLRHFSLPATRAMQQELETLREAYTGVSTELDGVNKDFQRTRDEDERLLSDLRQQIRQIRSERGQAQQQIEQLEHSLAHAEHRQKFAESHLESLEIKLDEERTRHDDHMQVTRTRLVHMQEEQRALLQQQTELTGNLGTLGERLLDAHQSDNRTSHFSLVQLALVSAALFISGMFFGLLIMQQLQDSNQKIEEVKHDIRNMRGFMRQHLENQDGLIKELSSALNRQYPDNPGSMKASVIPDELQTTNTEEPQPPAYQPDTQAITRMQAGLINLGFDTGSDTPDGTLNAGTRQAALTFRQYYPSLDDNPETDSQEHDIDETLLQRIAQAAEQVKDDVTRFNLDPAVLAAIRLGSQRSGVNHAFLMEFARAESNFNPLAQARDTSATGLYQYKSMPWLEAISAYGEDYGLQQYAEALSPVSGQQQAEKTIARDPVQINILALRLDPYLSTLVVADEIKRHLLGLSRHTKLEPGRADLYLAHLIGPAATITFLKNLHESPDNHAAELFPDAASNNPMVFFARDLQPRTLRGIYQWLEKKFNTGRYDDPSMR